MTKISFARLLFKSAEQLNMLLTLNYGEGIYLLCSQSKISLKKLEVEYLQLLTWR